MKRLPALLVVALLGAIAAGAAPVSTEDHVNAVFAELRLLKSMESRASYTLPAGGKNLTGRSDDFLRRRTADEISASRLSCGCGDYAMLFIERIRERGFEPLLVDSAQISLASLDSNYSGHAVVAIRPQDEPKASWWLVDSTARKIISRDWSPDAPTFTASGHVYWIGYCGPLERYPVHSPEELKRFYTRTLAQVPAEFFNRTLTRMVFTIDPSMMDQRSRPLNPNLDRLRIEQERILAKYRVVPEREISILLTRGADDGSGSLDYTDGRWVARVGLKSACSPHFLTYLEQKVRLAALE
jgi:hypothetical protein